MNDNQNKEKDCYVEDIQKALTYSITIILIMWGLSFIVK